MIPTIDIASLFGDATALRATTERAIGAAAAETGFMLVTGLPARMPITPPQLQILKGIFSLPPETQKRLWRQKFAPDHANVYRGWFPLQEGHQTYKEGIDIGLDLAHGAAVVEPGDPLREATPLPTEAELPGWRVAASSYYRAMAETGLILMQSIARGLDLDEHTFDAAFAGGISTLRLIHYPPRTTTELESIGDPDFWVEHDLGRAYLTGAAHVDSGLLTLLAQDGVSGLQARAKDGRWVDVPPLDNALVINFGRLLERWTRGRIKATQHRVIGFGHERYSIPFFFEPRVDAVIAPLDLPKMADDGGPASDDFAPFLYGDHLWAATTKFVEFAGMEGLRPPRG
jgi:isopenicillin N synthase-like dioxygenase